MFCYIWGLTSFVPHSLSSWDLYGCMFYTCLGRHFGLSIIEHWFIIITFQNVSNILQFSFGIQSLNVIIIYFFDCDFVSWSHWLNSGWVMSCSHFFLLRGFLGFAMVAPSPSGIAAICSFCWITISFCSKSSVIPCCTRNSVPSILSYSSRLATSR
jgi:hypothetical protein